MEDLSARIKNLEVRIRAGEKDETDTKTKTQVLPLSRVHPLFCVPRIFIFILEKKKNSSEIYDVLQVGFHQNYL